VKTQLRGDRKHDESRVAKSRSRRMPGYVPPYPNKTCGKLCSLECCGNPRRHYGDVTRAERLVELSELEQKVEAGLCPESGLLPRAAKSPTALTEQLNQSLFEPFQPEAWDQRLYNEYVDDQNSYDYDCGYIDGRDSDYNTWLEDHPCRS